MNRLAILFLFLIASILLGQVTRAESTDALDIEEDNAVNIVLTKLDVNDTKFELSWKIINNTDHDVWICDRLFPGDFFEWFLDTDDKTLIIRRRFDLPQGQGWEHLPRAYYVRLRPGQEKVDSISLTVPIREHTVFGPLLGHGQSATRMALEIGFYDEDLPGLILEIVEMAELLNCDVRSPANGSGIVPTDRVRELRRRFFGGQFIARAFYGESFAYFRDSITSGGDEVIIPYLSQTLNGEQTLRTEVDGFSIPLNRKLPPSVTQAGKGAKYLQSKKADGAKLAKSDRKKPSERKNSSPDK
jgi:hypothetical protein